MVLASVIKVRMVNGYESWRWQWGRDSSSLACIMGYHTPPCLLSLLLVYTSLSVFSAPSFSLPPTNFIKPLSNYAFPPFWLLLLFHFYNNLIHLLCIYFRFRILPSCLSYNKRSYKVSWQRLIPLKWVAFLKPKRSLFITIFLVN